MEKRLQKTHLKEDDNPVPIRMGELKSVYRTEAFKLDRSMQWVILQALKAYAKTFNHK